METNTGGDESFNHNDNNNIIIILYLYSAISLQPNSALQQSQFEKQNNTNSITVKNILKNYLRC